MKVSTYLKKAFSFSCCYSSGSKTIGRNYILWVVVEGLDPVQESAFVEKVQEALISKLHNCDLSMDVDFLKGLPITDVNLLEAVHAVLARSIDPHCKLVSLELDRDSSTKTIYACR